MPFRVKPNSAAILLGFTLKGLNVILYPTYALISGQDTSWASFLYPTYALSADTQVSSLYISILKFLAYGHFCPVPGRIIDACSHHRCQFILCFPFFLEL